MIEYSIFRPAGNDTAFVYGTDYTKEQKKEINDIIMSKHSNVEQVGFIDTKEKNELQMAGGEFCGNATRSAAYVYLKGQQGQIKILVNSKDIINAGVTENQQAWCEIPLYYGDDVITNIDNGIYIVKMNGMVTVVIEEDVAKLYINDKEKLKKTGMEFIDKYNLRNNEAVGVMFCEKVNNVIKINPIVWVNAIDTLFYETACGSGTTATCMVEAYKKKQNQTIDILQPSGLIITGNITYEDGKITKATILGDIQTDGIIYKI